MNKVRILGGRAGRCLPMVLREIGQARELGEAILLLVPEQYTLQAERELIDALHLPGLIDLDVLSPSRLRRRVREWGGHAALQPLDDLGRSMALSQALTQVQSQLVYYRRVAATPGLPDKLSTLLADMQKAALTPDDLRAYAQTLPEGASRSKETDLALIWETYEKLIEGRFADASAQEFDLRAHLAASGVMTDASVWVYGFDVLQQPMCDLLADTALLCRRLTVTMTMDKPEAPDGRIFQAQQHSVQLLTRQLNTRQVPWTLNYLPAEKTSRDPALQYLETSLFTRRITPYAAPTDAVAIHASATPFAESAHAARTLRLWHDAGIPWKRMAVAVADPTNMTGALGVTLQASGIPHYLVRKDTAMRHGLCRMLLGALRSATGGYQQGDVLLMAKSGFSPLTDIEALRLENYAIENGINRAKWLRPFTRGETAEEMEALRLRLITPVEALRTALREARSSAASMEAVYQLLEDVGAYDRLLARENALLERGLQAEAAQNRQVWQIVLNLIDQLYALLGDSRAVMKDIARFMESGLVSSGISSLPPAPDTVMIGEVGHLMTGRLDALLVVGMQDGVLMSSLNSLMTEEERAALNEGVHCCIGLTREQQASLRQSDFYRTLSLPERYLTLTYSQGTQDGAALRESGLLVDIQSVFPDLHRTGGVTADGMTEPPLAPLTALDGLALRLRALLDGKVETIDPEWLEALRWLWQSERYGGMTRQMVAGLQTRLTAPPLSRAQSAKLFGQDCVSISRLEEFAACPYRHFIDYGLKPVERRNFTFEADEKGSFFHEALCEYATLAAAEPAWPNIDDDAIEAMMDRVLSPLTKAWEGGPLREDAIGVALGEDYIRTVRRAAWMFTRHARNSHFTTWGAEVVFGQEGGLPPVILTLKNGRKVALRGKIDRIDRFEGDHGLYLRVVDYKSSGKTLEPVRMWYGLQLQLLLYLEAAAQGVQGAKPAGAFYFTVNDPLVDSPEDIKTAAEQCIAKELQLKGIVLAEAEVVDAMDVDIPSYSMSKIFNADGTVSANASAVDLTQMHALLNHTRKKAAELCDSIREGVIEVAPATITSWSACDFCNFAAICRKDPLIPGGENMQLPRLSKQEFLDMLANESSSGE